MQNGPVCRFVSCQVRPESELIILDYLKIPGYIKIPVNLIIISRPSPLLWSVKACHSELS